MKKYIPHLLTFIFLLSFSGFAFQAQAQQAYGCSCVSGFLQCVPRSDGSYDNPTCSDTCAGTVACTEATVNGPTGATANGQNITATINNPFGSGTNTLPDLFKLLINNLLIPIGGVAAVLAFIYSGFLYVMAQGDETKIKTAHRALLYTAIGTAILLGAAVISSVINATINQLR